MSEHTVFLAVQRQIAGLEAERHAHLMQIAGLVEERDAYRARVAELEALIAAQDGEADHGRV